MLKTISAIPVYANMFSAFGRPAGVLISVVGDLPVLNVGVR